MKTLNINDFINRKVTIAIFSLSLMLFIPTQTQSQESDFGSWYMYFGNKKLDSKWNIHHEVQYRNYNFVGDLEQLLLRTGLGYNLSENNNNIMLGYGYILSENYIGDTDDKEQVNEHRIFQQFLTKQNFNGILLSHRYRFEQRFIEGDFKLRFRYFLGINVPISNKEIIDKTFYASAYNEIFLNTESPVFDRNRLYVGVGFKVNNKVRLETGYMNQFFESSGRDQWNTMIFYTF